MLNFFDVQVWSGPGLQHFPIRNSEFFFSGRQTGFEGWGGVWRNYLLLLALGLLVLSPTEIVRGEFPKRHFLLGKRSEKILCSQINNWVRVVAAHG